MALHQVLVQGTVQQMILTPKMQQAIEILQLSSLELERYIEQQLTENVLLEEEPTQNQETEDFSPPEQSLDAETPPDSVLSTVEFSLEELEIEVFEEGFEEEIDALLTEPLEEEDLREIELAPEAKQKLAEILDMDKSAEEVTLPEIIQALAEIPAAEAGKTQEKLAAAIEILKGALEQALQDLRDKNPDKIQER